MMKESAFQSSLIKKLYELYPGCVILKNDANYRQGFPDLLVLFEDKWVALEVKADVTSKTQPNQPFWVSKLRDMSYAAFIFPQNEMDVLHEIRKTFKS